ncbi:MAG: lysophospholipase [Saprospiraceae bacterium]|nr:lysophospholipase [Pyrinomonadaceae bacterium]
MNEGTFDGVGGLNIFWRSWRPEGTPRAVIALIHGFNAHSGYFEWAAEQLTANGLAVYALDFRGRGKSDGERFYVETFSEYMSDVTQLVDMARSSERGLPVFILGHSAGGVIASSYAHEHQNELAGLICESFAFDVGVPDIAQLLLKGLSHIAPHLHVFTLKNEWFSRDPAAVAAMNSDPLIAKESQPTETAAVMLGAADELEKKFPTFTLPLFILHGTEDKATRPSGSQAFYDGAASTDKTLKLYEGHYHDLLNDIDKEVVMADIQNWIDQRIPAETSSATGA